MAGIHSGRSRPSPSPTPTPSPSPTPLTSLGADREAFSDDFSVSGIWGTVDDEVTSILYQDDSLVVTHKQGATSRTST